VSEVAVPDSDPKGDEAMNLFDHLQELRVRLFKCLAAFSVLSIAGWFLYERILDLLVSPLKKLPEAEKLVSQGKLIFTSPPEALFIRLKITAFAGFIMALPVILWQVWRFVTPGLYRREKRYAIPFVFTSMLLFAMGTTLAFISLPQTLRFLVALAGTEFVLVPRASEYLSFILLLVVAFGATFEFPLVLVFLALAGVITSRTLRKGRRTAWVAVLLAAAIVTPTQDPFTMLALAVPLGLLYELTILTIRALKR